MRLAAAVEAFEAGACGATVMRSFVSYVFLAKVGDVSNLM